MAKKRVALHPVDREIGRVISALKKIATTAEPADKKEIRRRLSKLGKLRRLTRVTCSRAYQMWPPTK